MCTSRPPVSDIGPCAAICVVPGSGRTSDRIGRCGVAEATTGDFKRTLQSRTSYQVEGKNRESRQRIYLDFESVGKMRAL